MKLPTQKQLWDNYEKLHSRDVAHQYFVKAGGVEEGPFNSIGDAADFVHSEVGGRAIVVRRKRANPRRRRMPQAKRKQVNSHRTSRKRQSRALTKYVKSFTGSITRTPDGQVVIQGTGPKPPGAKVIPHHNGTRRNPAWGVKFSWHAPTGAFSRKADAQRLAQQMRDANKQAGLRGAVKVVKVG